MGQIMSICANFLFAQIFGGQVAHKTVQSSGDDQVCEKRVQMQVKGVSELGVHLHGRR